MIAGFAERGCGAVVLASSEAPLLISAENSPLPVFDAADILAETAIRRVTALTAAAAGVSERPQG
jgi:aspartate/glutamate racemase